MASATGVSRRTEALYRRFYADRVEMRCESLYRIFLELARRVDGVGFGVTIEIDYLRLAEIVRSYFLDVIRYKEYHLDFRAKPDDVGLPDDFDAEATAQLDPLDPRWAEAVHLHANINASKVAAYTVKWILKYKPISVISTSTIAEQQEAEIAPLAPFLADINEQYALQCALIALELDSENVPGDVINELIYSFRFRAFDETAYFMLLSKQYLCGGGGGC